MLEFSGTAAGLRGGSAEVVVCEFPQAVPVEAAAVARVGGGYVQVGQERQAAPVGRRVGFGEVVDEMAVVDDVAGEQRPGAFFEEGDAAGGVSGQVQDGQRGS